MNTSKNEKQHTLRRLTLLREVQEQQRSLRPVDERVLFLLLRTPFLSVQEIALFFQRDQKSVYPYLQALLENGLIEYLSVPLLGTTKRRVYSLSNLGLYVLAAQMGCDAYALARHWQTDECGLLRLLPRLKTLVTVQSVLFDLLKQAPHTQRQEGRTLQWRWKRELRFPLPAEQQALLGREAALAWSYSPHANWYLLLLVLDHGLPPALEVEQQVRSLLQVRSWYEEQEKACAFPTVLILAPTSSRQQMWTQVMQEVARQQHVLPLAGAITLMREIEVQGRSHASFWDQPWHRLTDHHPCTLQAVLTPTPARHIPFLRLLESPDVVEREEPRGCRFPRARPTPLTLIKGHFTERAARLELPSMREHETFLGLLSLHLGARHLGVLHLLFRLPLLSLQELATLLSYQEASLLRYIRELHQYGCLASLQVRQRRRWYLTELGIRLLALVSQLPCERMSAHALATLGRDIHTLQALEKHQASQRKRAHAKESAPTLPGPIFRLITFACLLVALHRHSLASPEQLRIHHWEVGQFSANTMAVSIIEVEVCIQGSWQHQHLLLLWVAQSRTIEDPPRHLLAIKETLKVFGLHTMRSGIALVCTARKERPSYLPLADERTAGMQVQIVTPGMVMRHPLSMLGLSKETASHVPD